MEFNEKLQKLRKSRGLTQEELAEALFVSRTAVSRWESGRGYPGIDTLKELSRFFSVTIDELVGPEEILSAAEEEKKQFAGRYISLICGALDILLVLLLFLPVFGDGSDPPAAVSLFAAGGIFPGIRIVFAAVILIAAANGVCGVVISRLDRPLWNRHRVVTGMILSLAGTVIFMAARQPYAGLICLALMVVKGILLIKEKKLILGG